MKKKISPSDLPQRLRARLHPGESVHHVVFVEAGVRPSPAAPRGPSPAADPEHWVLLTNHRLLFGSSGAAPASAARDREARVVESGCVQLDRVSAVTIPGPRDEAAGRRADEGAGAEAPARVAVTAHGLRILLPVPSSEEAVRLHRALVELMDLFEQSA